MATPAWRARLLALYPSGNPATGALSAAEATRAMGFVLALVNAVMITVTLPLPASGLQVRALGLVYDAGQMIALGLIAGGVVSAWERWGPRRPAWGLAALAGVSVSLGFVLLYDDLFGFAQRVGTVVPPVVLHPLSIALVSLAVPVAAVLGRLFARPYLRFVALAAALGAGALNHWLLRSDYPGAHIYLGALAASLGASALTGAVPPWRRSTSEQAARRPSRLASIATSVGQGAVALWAAFALISAPSGAVQVDLLQASGAILAPIVARAHARLAARRVSLSTSGNPWFADRSTAPPVPPTERRLLPRDGIVVLLSVDAMRADVLTTPDAGEHLPALKALERESVDFTRTRSPGSQTVYSLTTLFAGTYFSQQYWSPMKDGKDRSLWPNEEASARFPELLLTAGVRTVTFAAAVWLRNAWGVARGFAEEQFVPTKSKYASAAEVAGPAIERIRAHEGGPLFLYIHFLDPHAPYNRGGRTGTLFQRYVAEIELVDREIQNLRRAIKDKGLFDRTAIIVTADHGEAFGEHGTTEHATTLYEEQVRVPLLIRAPGVAPRKVDEPVSLVDLGPTVLDLFGQPTPARYMGQSLVPLLFGGRASLSRPIVAEGRLKRSLVFPDGYKIIADDRNGAVELYDLKSDPAEARNLYGDSEEAEARLAVLRAFFEAHTLRKDGYIVPYRP